MFATYEEADELRVRCPVCGKHNQTIFAHYKVDEPTFYTLDNCDLPNCTLHCSGHNSSERV